MIMVIMYENVSNFKRYAPVAYPLSNRNFSYHSVA